MQARVNNISLSVRRAIFTLHFKPERGERRKRDRRGKGLTVPRHCFGFDARDWAEALASIFFVVRIEYQPVVARDGKPNTESLADERREVADTDDAPPRRRRDAHEGQGVPTHVPSVYPLETFRVAVGFPERGLCGVKAVEVADERLQATMIGLLKQMPVEAAFLVPFPPLAQLPAHEEQLLAGMGPHVAVEGAQVAELVRALARHLVQERALAVHDLIM